MKLSIVGMGGMGNAHYNILREIEDAEIVALVDLEESRIQEKASQCGARAYTDLNEMLVQEKPDILVICTPSYLHSQQAIAAMKEGVHVLVEKPAALNIADLKAMLECADDNNVFLMVAFVLRFWKEYKWLKNAYSSNKYGKLLDLNMWRFSQIPLTSAQNWMHDKEKSGLVPFDLHIHDIDFMVYMLGLPIESDRYEIIENSAHCVETTCFYRGGSRVRSKAAWYTGAVHFQMGYEALFDKGLAIFDKDILTFYPNDGEAEIDVIRKDCEIDIANANAYHTQMNYFIDCVRNGSKPSIISEDELFSVLRLLGAG